MLQPSNSWSNVKRQKKQQQKAAPFEYWKKKTKDKLKKRKSIKKKIKPSYTIRLPNGEPLRAKLTFVKEHADTIDRKEYIGFVCEDNYIREGNGVVISKEIDGFPYLELNLDFIEEIQYIDPNEKAVVTEIRKEEKPTNKRIPYIGEVWRHKITKEMAYITSNSTIFNVKFTFDHNSTVETEELDSFIDMFEFFDNGTRER